MTWDDVLDRIRDAGLRAVEETYMEHYGKVLAAQRPEFENRIIRCTYGKVQCEGLNLEVFLFPSEGHLQDFMELIDQDPWWIARENAVIHFPECDPAIADKIVRSICKDAL